MPAIASIIVLCMTILLLVVINKIQDNNYQVVLESAASRQADLLREKINSDIDFIGSTANFFQSSTRSNWVNFHLFAREVVKNSESLMSLQWLEEVTPNNIDNYIENQRNSYPDFEIYTISDHKVYTFNGKFDGLKSIFVVSEIYPTANNNLDILGFYSESPRTQSFIHNISDSRQPNVSDSVSILSDTLELIKFNRQKKSIITQDAIKREKRGLLIYYPVFQNDTKHMEGIVVGVVDLTVYMKSIIHRSLNGIYSQIKIIDTGLGANSHPVMYQSPGWDSEKGEVLVRKVKLPNRTWIVQFKQSNSKKAQDVWVLLGVSVAGLIIAILVYYIATFQRDEKARIEAKLKIKTKELQFLVNRDTLTKLRNRRSFNYHIKGMIVAHKTFTLIGIDIDKFKVINDQFGHVFGDQALIHVAKIISSKLSRSDKLFRLGGDEFSIITQQTDPEKLDKLLSEMCLVVNNTLLHYKGNEVYCSLSVGAAIFHQSDDVETLMTRADNALYESKKKGRNCFSILP
ncbi:sensor domain-containing diguanylate cyclase [Photobacterium leiognathi]|uniref:diguanylate cyclase n=3 Tax=Photobacterium leiognathi TaxID=553611 RepID=X0NMU0_PHOLE|nr:sensor domain-containing diguanylate cyclase [Photobacterium leiognathi]PSV88791.1 sensor domain-containing diguanylate cyclase [Photobacterium leiognathi]GAD29292.1 diguanylate cyclase domain protein [Photobacterium leiognathi lrivu.4.1]